MLSSRSARSSRSIGTCSSTPTSQIALPYTVTSYPPSWLIEDEEQVPESRPHDLRTDRTRQLLEGWRERTGRNVQIGRNLALRWDEGHPRVGVDPDLYLVEPPPPEGDELFSIRTWRPGHNPPLLAVEIVSTSRPEKDYSESPLKYAANGTQELWVFDPNLFGRSRDGGPYRLQVWQRQEQDGEGSFVRVYAGEGPARSEVLDAWIFCTNEGYSLAIADDEEGTRFWMTPREMEAARADAERAEKEKAQQRADDERTRADAERAEKEKAQQRIAELEALLAAQKG